MLEIKQLCKRYPGGVQALNDVSLSIEKGMFGLLGPNGAGKSTLMRIISALLEPDSGTVHFNGQDVFKDPQTLRAQLGYLPQDFGVYPRISAAAMLDHIAILKGVGPRKVRREQVDALLQQTNLYAVRHKALSGYSGGMRQRFGIAQALIGDPKLIIVDEPTAGLDPEERNRFHNLLSDIGENVVVILSTHIVDDVSELCPRMAILAAGQVQQQGRPGDLVDTLRGKVWRKVIDKEELTEHQKRYAVISTRLLAGRTVVHVLADDAPQDGFEPLTPGLEDVYFSTVFGRRVA